MTTASSVNVKMYKCYAGIISVYKGNEIKACGVYGGQDDEQVNKDVLKGEYD